MAEEYYKAPDTGQEDSSTEIPIEDADAEASEKNGDNIKDEQKAGRSNETDTVKDKENNTEEEPSGTEDSSTDTNPSGEQPNAESSEDGADKKSGFFSRNKKPDKEKAAMKEKIDGLEDRVRRQMAEFDNYRKRTEKEKEESFSMGERNVIEKMLPIVDNFERGFDTVEEADKDDAFVTGMQKIYTQLMKQLTDLGVKPIEAVGKPFDPEYHNAVMQVDSDQYESGTVAQELQKGYLYHDQVIRHSMVAVVK